MFSLVKNYCFVFVVFLLTRFVTFNDGTVGKKYLLLLAPPLVFFRFCRHPPLLILRSRRGRWFFFNFFRLCPNLVMSSAF
jgi:hypothetical protein